MCELSAALLSKLHLPSNKAICFIMGAKLSSGSTVGCNEKWL